MRLITTLIIASVFGAVGAGGMEFLLQTDRASSLQKMSELLANDRETATRLIEQATFQCMPGLAKIRNERARIFLSRLIVLSISTGGEKMTKEEHQALVMKELRPVIDSTSEQDMTLLAKVVDQTKDERSKSMTCIIQTAIKSAESDAKPLLSDVELRGT